VILGMRGSQHRCLRSLRLCLALTLSTLQSVPSQAQWTGPQRTNAENLTVMIDASYQDVPTEWGTGIIIARRQNTLYIATAKHVLNRGALQDIQVSFRWTNPTLGDAAAQPITAKASLAAPLPPDLDLAVLKVELDPATAPSPDALLFAVLADPASIKPDLNVRPLGHVLGHYWITCDYPGSVSAVSGEHITFTADCTQDGHSGGPLFDEYWQLVGMVLRLQVNAAVGPTIDNVLATLKSWNIPVDLTRANAPQPNRFLAVSLGEYFACGITSTNRAFCWGRNEEGDLGVGRLDEGFKADVALPVADTHLFIAISAGAASACGLTIGNSILCWGRNDFGQLGDGTTASNPRPTIVRGNLHFVSVSTGRVHACGLTDDGAAYCWGGNGQGQLGNGTTQHSSTPTRVSSPNHWIQVSAGADATCAISTDHDTYCWGGDGDLLLNTSTAKPVTLPVKISIPLKLAQVSVGGYAGMEHDHLYTDTLGCGVSLEGGAYCWGSIFFKSANSFNFVSVFSRDGPLYDTHVTAPLRLLPHLTFSSVFAGYRNVCGIANNPKTVYCWGDGGPSFSNSFEITAGELKSEQKVDFKGEPSSVTVGITAACALSHDRKLYCWGGSQNGVLGNATGQYDERDEARAVHYPQLPVVTSRCSSSALPQVSSMAPYYTVLECGRSSEIIERIQSLPSEKTEMESFEDLLRKVSLVREIVVAKIRTCELKKDAPASQNILTLTQLEDQICNLWRNFTMMIWPGTPSMKARKQREAANSRLQPLVQQYRVTAAAPSLKDLAP
jgi:alpha-tubulin suppressor-like RCC1 family protein